MTHLYLIRHGQAKIAIEEALVDSGLTALGIKQAERLRDRLAATGEIAADVLIASTMPRAKQTAEILAPAFDLPLVFDDEVQEWREGKAEDLEKISVEEFKAKSDAVPLEQKPFFRAVPSSESWTQFMLRAATALQRITSEHEGKTIVIICHAGIVDCSMIFFFGMSSLQFPKAYFDTHNTSITHWHRRTDGNLPPGWVLEDYNDAMHLRDIDTPVGIPWRELARRPVVGSEKSKAATEVE